MATSDFDFRTLSAEEAAKRRRELGVRSGRRSKYTPVGEQAMGLQKGDVLAFSLSANQLVSLRNYMSRNFADQFRVSSRRAGEDMFEVHISHSEGAAPSRRGRKKKGEG